MGTGGSYDFKYHVEYTTMMHLSILNFLELLENGKVSHQNLYNFFQLHASLVGYISLVFFLFIFIIILFTYFCVFSLACNILILSFD